VDRGQPGDVRGSDFRARIDVDLNCDLVIDVARHTRRNGQRASLPKIDENGALANQLRGCVGTTRRRAHDLGIVELALAHIEGDQQAAPKAERIRHQSIVLICPRVRPVREGKGELVIATERPQSAALPRGVQCGQGR
jgi:hypothetical protein